MAAQLSQEAQVAARAEIDWATTGPSPRIAGLVYCAVNRNGDIILSNASGQTGLDSKRPMTLDTTFWMASCTKLITSIACMQLVEQGKLHLDNIEQVELLAPELKAVQVLERTADGGFDLVPKNRAITLRMLLNHTGKQTSLINYGTANSKNSSG